MLKNRLLHALLALACIAGLVSPAQADYPDRPIKLILPYAAGAGAMDLAARLISDQLTVRVGNPVIVVNQPGASGTIAAAATARGPKAGIEVAPLDRKAFGAKMAADLAVWEGTLRVSGLTQ